MENKKIVVCIPARGGSKGIPKKNIVDLVGKPLIAHSIEAAKNCELVSEVYVSTEDKEIAEISKSFGAKIVDRPMDIAVDTASSEAALLHFAEKVDFDILVFMQCTSPLTRSYDIEGAIKLFLTGYDSVLSVTEDHGGFLCGGFTWDEDGQSVNYDYKNRPRRQERKKTYRENGAIYITSKDNLLKHKNRLNGRVGIFEMPSLLSYEIDSPDDLDFLRKIWPITKTDKNNQ